MHHIPQCQVHHRIKIYKNSLQSHAISKGHSCRVSLQKGHLKVTCKRKSTYRNSVSAWFSKWTSLGLNQGPPDYESVALTNWATSPACQHGCDKFCGAKVRIMSEMCKFFSLNLKKCVSVVFAPLLLPMFIFALCACFLPSFRCLVSPIYCS